MKDERSSAITRWEWAGLAVLFGAVVMTLKISWLKWPDPIIDFGRELYVPWRINEGAVLYRDMDAAFGPLSHYFNALIFRIAGPGLMHLVVVNLAIYAAILALIYCEVRAGWGRLAAFAASLFFIVAFSFSQFVRAGNYNFATPYAHETSHGFLLLLVLIATATSWLCRPRWWKAAAAGAICGLCALLKVEILFAAAAVTLCAMARAIVTRSEMRRLGAWLRDGGVFIAAGLVPPLVATAVLWSTGAYSPWQAFSWANVGWMGLFVYKGIAQDPIQATFMGTANAAENLRVIALYGGLSVAAACAACGLGWLAGRTGKIGIALAVTAAAGAVFVALKIPWTEVGRIFPVWLCLAAILAFRPAPNPASANLRWLILLAASALLARMALNPRIYHYGYCEASLAGIVAVATAFRALPDRFALVGRARGAYVAVLAAFFAVGLAKIERVSAHLFSLKTLPIGEGADRFYGFQPQFDPKAFLFEETRKILAGKSDCRTLLVLPEGVFLNYLLRKPGPTHVYVFNLYWLKWHESVVQDLERNPPDYTVLISRDLREYGIGRFGDSSDHGSTILEWVRRNCRVERQIGGDPLDVNQRGVTILKSKDR